MRKILKQILILSFTLITSNYIWKNLDFQNKLTTIILVALILSIFESIIKPIIKILLLPITIITLGTTRILINTLGLYLAVFLIHNFELKNINIKFLAIVPVMICINCKYKFFVVILGSPVFKKWRINGFVVITFLGQPKTD